MDIPIWFFGIVLFITIFAPILVTNMAGGLGIEPQAEIELNQGMVNFLEFVEGVPLIGGFISFIKNIMFDRIVLFAQYFPPSIAWYVYIFFGIMTLLSMIGIVVLARRMIGFS